MTVDAKTRSDNLLQSLGDALRNHVTGVSWHRDQFCLTCSREWAYPILEELKKQNPNLVLADVTAIDFLNKDTEERFAVVYVVQDRTDFGYFRIHAWVPEEDAKIKSVTPLFKLAYWGERECHDMFGIVFEGNPDLRRHLMPEDYPGFPLLKDYPLKGHGERAQFTKVVPEGDHVHETKATVYPVTIGRGMHTPEYFKALREDSQPTDEEEAK